MTARSESRCLLLFTVQAELTLAYKAPITLRAEEFEASQLQDKVHLAAVLKHKLPHRKVPTIGRLRAILLVGHC